MPKVKNEHMANSVVNVDGVEVQFNAEGVADVSAEVAKTLADVPSYDILEEAKVAPKSKKTADKVEDAAVKAEE